MDWLDPITAVVGGISGLVAILTAIYKVQQARRHAAILTLVVKSPEGKPLLLAITNVGKRTLYAVTGEIEFLDEASLPVTVDSFICSRLAEGDSTNVPVPASGLDNFAMPFHELAMRAQSFTLTVRFRYAPRARWTHTRRIRAGVTALAQGRPILADGDVL